MAKARWMKNEEDCANYFMNKFSKLALKIKPEGKFDATAPDIDVFRKDGEKFGVEIKSEKSQCGQFVVTPCHGYFEYGRKNKSDINEYSSRIIEHMNNNFEKYADAGTAGVDLGMDQSIYIGWIKTYYSNKGVKLFITKINAEYIIFPIEKFEDFFDVSAKYRMKKSGSSDVPKYMQKGLFEFLLKENKIESSAIAVYGKKLLIKSSRGLKNSMFHYGEYDFIFSGGDNGYFVIKKLSNTKNSNVIFSIILKQGVRGLDDNAIKCFF